MDVKDVEREIEKFWKRENTYANVKMMRSNGKPFYFCDGPPYATGEIHPGTAWNKAMKDAYCRYYRMRGYNVRDQAGFDTHGLPIEVKVEKKLGIKNKSEIENKIGLKKFIDECKLFATKYIGVMSDQFRSIGVWLDFDNPYLTYQNSFIEKSWSTIKKAHEKGLLVEQLYVVPFCSRCETTSANYELEYYDKTDPSILVKFRVSGTENKYLLIWTTTPWTLPANVAVMAHPSEEYVEAQVGNEIWVFAKERLDFVKDKIDHDVVVLSSFSGLKLKGLGYEHPLKEEVAVQRNIQHRVVMSDRFVTMEEGTGLVHTAPGHGPEDFVVGKENNLEIICPVLQNGRFAKDAGKYEGYYVFDANKTIITDLNSKNLLAHEEPIRHRYAHCWRCKTPLIYLATKQWFVKVGNLKREMDSEIEKTYWRPEYARKQFRAFVSDAPDWCISRQRYWGIPLPIWKCHCGAIKVVGSVQELPVKLEDLHRPEIDDVMFECAECASEMRRVKDVLDVWFDSGNVVWASLNEDENYEQADLILEGKDQIRGWFYSLLGSGVVNIGKSPYKSVMMHGYFTDEKGEKMSKSVGNFVPLSEILEKTSIDTFRFWGMQNVAWDDIKFNWDELNDVKRFLVIVLNVAAYMQRFYEEPSDGFDANKLEVEDEWLLLKLNNVIKECTDGFEKLEMHRGARALKNFLVDDLSRFYMKIAKRRVSGEISAEAVNYVMYKVFFTALKLLAPFAPHITEHIYQQFYKKHEHADSIHMCDWPEPEKAEYDPALVEEFRHASDIISAIGNARNEAKRKARWPLAEAAIITENRIVEKTVQRLSRIIEQLTNVKSIRIAERADEIEYGEFIKLEAEEFTVYLDTHVNSELYAEGMKSEIVRRIQAMRKEKGLVESDKIDVLYNSNEEINNIIEKYLPAIAKSVKAMSIKKDDLAVKGKKWRIEGNTIEIEIKVID